MAPFFRGYPALGARSAPVGGGPRYGESSRISAPPGVSTGPQFRDGGGQVSFVGGGTAAGSAPGLPSFTGGGGGGGGGGGLTTGGGVGSMMPGAIASSTTRGPTGPAANPQAAQYGELLKKLMEQFSTGQQGARDRAEQQYQQMLGAVAPTRENLDSFAHSQRTLADATGQANLDDVANIGEAARRRTADDAARQQALMQHQMMTRGMAGTTAHAGVQRGVAADTQRRNQEIDEQQAMLRTGVRDTTADRQLGIIGNRAAQEMPLSQMYANVHAARQEDTMNPNVLLSLIQQLSAASN